MTGEVPGLDRAELEELEKLERSLSKAKRISDQR
jgi:hypothetical protein